MNNSNSLFIKALNKEKLPTPPVWYMRQAGRYMPEYRKVRKNFKNFLDMCKNPEVCCELALQPIEAFKLDAAILFSDILTIPDAFGFGVKFVENEGPVFENPVRSISDIKNLNAFDPENLNYVYKAVSNIKNELPEDLPLIGFSGSPWTLAAYSIEGRSSKDFERTINFINSNKEEAHYFLSRLTDACFLYLRKQVQAGADVIQIFDSWANVLNSEELVEYSINYTKSLIDALKKDQVTSNTPVILFSRDPKCDAETLINTSADCISLYWGMNKFDLDKANGKIAIQGNLNPSILLESKDVIKKEAYKILEKFKDFPGYIFNLGHGITPDIDPENIKYLTDIVRKF
jgi:uroporphyrinogen decarboxylase